MTSTAKTCPSCGMPAAPDAAFCDNCGAEFPCAVATAQAAEPVAVARPAVAAEPRATTPDERDEAVPAPSAAVEADGQEGFEILQAALSSGHFQRDEAEIQATPTPPRAADAPKAQTPPKAADRPQGLNPLALSADAPFIFEWDNAREFIEGVRCNFAFRLRINAPVEELTIKADVDGETLVYNPFTSLAAGDERKGTLPFIPKVAGALSVRVLAEVRYKKGCRESFEAVQPFEHQASPFRRFLSDGYQNIDIDIRDNSGLIRLDDLKLPPPVLIDLKEEITRALSRRDGWGKVLLASNAIGLEAATLCAGERTLTVLSGNGPLYFGRSHRRATVQLFAENADGQIDERRYRFVSGIHFTLINRGTGELLRDGGPSNDGGQRVWHKSSNGMAVNGQMYESDQELKPGKTYQVLLAPSAVPGGALSLSLETRGHASAIPGCDRACELASIAMRRSGLPDRAVLVVLGSAPIDDLLGTRTGLSVGQVRGRLRLIRRDGSSKRLLHLVGEAIPGTDIFVQ